MLYPVDAITIPLPIDYSYPSTPKYNAHRLNIPINILSLSHYCISIIDNIRITLQSFHIAMDNLPSQTIDGLPLKIIIFRRKPLSCQRVQPTSSHIIQLREFPAMFDDGGFPAVSCHYHLIILRSIIHPTIPDQIYPQMQKASTMIFLFKKNNTTVSSQWDNKESVNTCRCFF